MALDFSAFQPKNTAAAADQKAAKPKAEFWLNIGYIAQVDEVQADGTKKLVDKFVSLALGIPLDSVEDKAMTRNAAFNQLLAAQNDLRAQLMDLAKTMEAGAEKIIGGSAEGLCIQLRRVNAAAEAPEAESNSFIRKLALAA